jgi:hypothetical protein
MLIKFLCFNFLFLPAYNNALAALATWFPGNPDFFQEKTLQSAHLSVSPLYYITKNDRTKNTASDLLKKTETGSIGKALGSF